MKTAQDWITEIDFQVEQSLEKKRNTYYYGYSLEMDKSTSKEVELYFKNKGYTVEVRECPRKLWDIIISA